MYTIRLHGGKTLREYIELNAGCWLWRDNKGIWVRSVCGAVKVKEGVQVFHGLAKFDRIDSFAVNH